MRAAAKHGDHGIQVRLVEGRHNGPPPGLPGLQVCRDEPLSHDGLQDLGQHALVIVEGVLLHHTLLGSGVEYSLSRMRQIVCTLGAAACRPGLSQSEVFRDGSPDDGRSDLRQNIVSTFEDSGLCRAC